MADVNKADQSNQQNQDVNQDADMSNQQQQNGQSQSQGDVNQQGQQSQGAGDVNQQQHQAGDKTDPALLLKSLQEERAARRELEAQVAALGGNAQQQQQQPGQQNFQTQINEMWETGDYRRAMQAEMAVAFNWFDNVNAELDTQRETVRAKYPDFNRYESKAMSYVRTLPLEQRAKKGVVELAYLVQKGQDSNNIYQQAQQEILEKLRRGESIQGLSAGTAQAPMPKGKQPTEDQIKAAEAMGVPITDYMASMKG